MDKLPEKNSNYNRMEYWDQRYFQEESFEWCKSYAHFAHLIRKHVKPTDRILMLGCGNSSLSEDMYQDGYQSITNVDYSSVVVSNMKNRSSEARHMKWLVMDITDMKFDQGSFDVVIEKATLDALLVDEKDPWHLSEHAHSLMNSILTQVSDVLTNDGRFISITFSQPHFRKRMYGQQCFKWDMDVSTFGTGFHFFFYVMTKGRNLIADDENSAQPRNDQAATIFLQQEDCSDYLCNIEA